MIIHEKLILAACLILTLVGCASAEVINGGFESGSLVGWTTSYHTEIFYYPTYPQYAAHSGIYSACIFSGQDYLSQQIDLTGVQSLSWYDMWVGVHHDGLRVSVDSDTVYEGPFAAGLEWKQHTVDLSQYTGLHTITFTYTGEVGMLIDDISIAKYQVNNGPSDKTIVILVGTIPRPSPEPTLSLSSEVSHVGFGQFNVGDNFADNVGYLYVTAKDTAWQTTVSDSPGIYGYMNDGEKELTNALFQKDADGLFKWVSNQPGTHWSWEGESSSIVDINALPLSYKQTVDAADKPGDYSISLTYTATAA